MDFYIILGLERSATVSDVKRAYRRLARKYHPDINPGDRASATFFRRVNEAYETLMDPARRRWYDAGGARTEGPALASFEFQGFDFSTSADGPSASTFGDLFADVFLGADAGSAPAEDGADLHLSLALSFDEAMRGVERNVTVTRLETCPGCHGIGRLRMTEGRCVECRGTGSLGWARGHMVFSKSCTHCGGSGRHQHRTCSTCDGDGVVPRTEVVAVRVPAGVADGGRVRMAGYGHAGRRGGKSGDLYLDVAVAPHPVFERHDDDLYLVVPVAIHEAALGAKIEVPTPDGTGRVRIPPGTQSGQRFRLRGRGAPSARGGRRGDLVVEVRLVLPRLVDERSKELLREFGRLNAEDVRRDL